MSWLSKATRSISHHPINVLKKVANVNIAGVTGAAAGFLAGGPAGAIYGGVAGGIKGAIDQSKTGDAHLTTKNIYQAGAWGAAGGFTASALGANNSGGLGAKFFGSTTKTIPAPGPVSQYAVNGGIPVRGASVFSSAVASLATGVKNFFVRGSIGAAVGNALSGKFHPKTGNETTPTPEDLRGSPGGFLHTIRTFYDKMTDQSGGGSFPLVIPTPSTGSNVAAPTVEVHPGSTSLSGGALSPSNLPPWIVAALIATGSVLILSLTKKKREI